MLFEEFGSDQAKGVSGGDDRRHFVELSLEGRIGAGLQELPRSVPTLARVGQRCCREGAESEHLLDSAKPVAVAPELVAVWLDEEVEATPVGELVWRGVRLGVLHLGV
jgi:hypothetical protein